MNLYRQFKSFAARAFNPRRWLAAIKRKAVRLEVAAISLLLMPVILVMADHLPFIDVPSNAFYHDAVSAIFGARITIGTTLITFSPEDPVTRGQMAVFLHRGLGRVAYTEGEYLDLSDALQEIARVTIDTGGGIAGGIGFLKVDAAFNVNSDTEEDCPCTISYYLDAANGPNSQFYYLTVDNNRTGTRTSSATGAATLAFQLATSRTQIVRLYADIIESGIGSEPGEIGARASISAIWVPFGATGGNSLSAASAEQGEAPPGTESDAKPDAQK